MQARLSTIMGFVAVFLTVLYLNRVAGDTWWSLRMGEETLQGLDPKVERWPWTSAGNYYPNHEIFFQVLVYMLWVAGGKTLALVYLLQAGLVAFGLWLLLPKAPKGQKDLHPRA